MHNLPPSPLKFVVEMTSGGRRRDVGTVVLSASTVAKHLAAARATGRSSWRPYFLVTEAEQMDVRLHPPLEDGIEGGMEGVR